MARISRVSSGLAEHLAVTCQFTQFRSVPSLKIPKFVLENKKQDGFPQQFLGFTQDSHGFPSNDQVFPDLSPGFSTPQPCLMCEVFGCLQRHRFGRRPCLHRRAQHHQLLHHRCATAHVFAHQGETGPEGAEVGSRDRAFLGKSMENLYINGV